MSQDLVADDVKFTLDPYESIEYKYRIQEGRSIVYTWEASDEVVFEFHGELEGQPEGEAETYQLGRAEGASGRFSAPANGVHGWYWQNRSFSAVTVSLTAVGFIDGALTFSRVGVQERNIGSTEE